MTKIGLANWAGGRKNKSIPAALLPIGARFMPNSCFVVLNHEANRSASAAQLHYQMKMRTPETEVRDLKRGNACRIWMALLVLCTLIAALPARAANIVFVSFHSADGTPSTAA